MHSSKVISTGTGLDAPQAELADRIARNTPHDGVHPCAIGALNLIRFSSPQQPLPTVYEPSLCIVVQGRKRALLGQETYTYDPLNYLLVSMSLPVIGQVIEASPERPYLCLRIDIEPALIGEVLLQAQPPSSPTASTGRALMLARMNAPLLDAVLRLVRLLDSPDEAPVLAPLALREIHFRVLKGELGPRLLRLCEADGHAQKIARAIGLLKQRYTEPLSIEELASAAHMSVSSLHHRFKAATSLSPLQYQKQLRLREARSLMLLQGLDAAAAAHRVGYESASQFSREYRRLFGAPPREEIEAVLAAGRLALSA